LELEPCCVSENPYSAVGTAVPYRYLTNEFQFQIQACVRVCVLVYVHVLCPCPCSCPVRVLVCVRDYVNIKFGAKNIYVLHGNYIVDFQRLYKVARKLKGPPT
jgi:hypothetical protein